MTVTLFEFPYEHENYGAAHSMEKIDGETWFTAGSNYSIQLGTGKSAFEYQTSGGTLSGIGSNLRYSHTIKFKLDVDSLTGTLRWKFSAYTDSASHNYHKNTYTITKAILNSYGATGIVNITIHVKREINANYGIFQGSVSLYINGNLAETLTSTSSRIVQVTTPDRHYLEIPQGTRIASVITRLTNADIPVESFLRQNHKCVRLNPVEQIAGEDELPLTPTEFTNGFVSEAFSEVKFSTDLVEIPGATYRAVTAVGKARFQRRSPKYGTASSTLRAGASNVTHFNSNSASGFRGLSLLNVGVDTWTRLDGHAQLNSTDPETMRTISVAANISHTNG